VDPVQYNFMAKMSGEMPLENRCPVPESWRERHGRASQSPRILIPVQSGAAWYLAVGLKEEKRLHMHCKIDTPKEAISALQQDLFWFLGGVLLWSKPEAQAIKHTAASSSSDIFIADALCLCVWAREGHRETTRAIHATEVEEVENTLRSLLEDGESN
jgi:hypothetical protein